jgi:TPR repeat protein
LKVLLFKAEAGDAKAQSILGNVYLDGQGVPQDYAEAIKWYRKAADQGDAEAQYSLGEMYDIGQALPQDYVQAHMWFSLAAARGYQGSAEARRKVENRMTPEQIAEAQRLARVWQPTLASSMSASSIGSTRCLGTPRPTASADTTATTSQ